MNWLKLDTQMMTRRKKGLDMKDRMIQALVVVGILAGFIAFIAVEWNYIGKIIFALIFVPFLLLPSMWIVIFVATITFIFLQKVVIDGK